MEPSRRALHTRGLPVLAAALLLAVAVPTGPVSGKERTFRALKEVCGVATFKLPGLEPSSIETARLRLSGLQRRLPLASVRAGARRGVLRAPLGSLLRERVGYRRLCELRSARARALRWAAEAGKSGTMVRGRTRSAWLKRAQLWRFKARRLHAQLPTRRGRRPSSKLVLELTTDPSEDPLIERPGPGDPVIAAAGDIAGEGGSQQATSDLLLSLRPSAVLTLGDNAYPDGTLAEFETYYAPSWGRLLGITHPAPGNHEYANASGAVGYFDYFGAAAGPRGKGYYSYDVGRWHLIALNSSIERDSTSEQWRWLKDDLAAHPARCTLAYWHHPRFSSGLHGNNGSMQTFWDALDGAGADVVLNGHDHSYERFGPQNARGGGDSNGVRQFVVGTGGRSLRGIPGIQANSEVRNSEAFGVLRLTLHPGSYEWRFVPAAGGSFSDSGSDACH